MYKYHFYEYSRWFVGGWECINKIVCKCPELIIKLNNVSVSALIVTGSIVNAVSEEWFNRNKVKMKRVDMLRLTNTHIKGAHGKNSKLIRHQMLVEIFIQNIKIDAVFLVVPSLIRECILGTEILRDAGYVIDFQTHIIKFNNNQKEFKLMTICIRSQNINCYYNDQNDFAWHDLYNLCITCYISIWNDRMYISWITIWS